MHFGGQQFALAPFGQNRVLGLINRLPIAGLLAGVRGAAAADTLAAAKALSCFSGMCAALGSGLRGGEVNPVVVSSSGVVAVDGLVIPALSGC